MLLDAQIKNLDLVLNYINSVEYPHRINYDDLTIKLKNKVPPIDISSKDLTAVVAKLVKDENIREERFSEECSPCYFMTLEGISLEANKGYKELEKESSIIKARKLEKEITDLTIANNTLQDYANTRIFAKIGLGVAIVGLLPLLLTLLKGLQWLYQVAF